MGARAISAGSPAAATFRSPAPGSTIRRRRRRSTTSRSARSPAPCGSRTRAVDFGASDVPLKSEELQQARARPVSDRDRRRRRGGQSRRRRPGQIKLTGPLLADIFLGKIAELDRSGDQGAQSRPETARRQDRRRSSLGRLRHDLQFHRLSVARSARNGRTRSAPICWCRGRSAPAPRAMTGVCASRRGRRRIRSAMSNIAQAVQTSSATR